MKLQSVQYKECLMPRVLKQEFLKNVLKLHLKTLKKGYTLPKNTKIGSMVVGARLCLVMNRGCVQNPGTSDLCAVMMARNSLMSSVLKYQSGRKAKRF
jgi:hypothetical protein